MNSRMDGSAATLRTLRPDMFSGAGGVVVVPVTSPVFNAFLPKGAIFGLPAGTIGPLVSDGFWLLLSPLSPGAHTIHLHAKAITGFETEATYQLNISQ